MRPQGYYDRPDPNHAPIEGPFGTIPPLILALAAAMAVIEVAFSLGATGLVGGPQAVGWRIAAIEGWSVVPAALDRLMVQWDWPVAGRFLGYPFLHHGPVHAMFAIALLLALGKFVGEVLHPLSLVVLLVASTLVGALAYGLGVGANYPLIGAYPMVYGLIGGFTYLMWLKIGRGGGNRLAAFRLIGVLMALQLVFGLMFGGDPAWVADAAGFIAGLVLSPLLAPGGASAFLERMRAR
ncbi:rhomboid family intramembrane serine protease [Limimaricola pyoseonensis]|uniref:Membrane associated serine protease, rhomboid family n=1 Tax=Limimaricola pyoseonensis TaxID=521013 RepID=A0A1G7C713_9RHOB|nr:rhomboid family intramembrane serine protease [Limimaricola pyoseonensis]SDE35099.1 Membrane associated serine protease, rhomboid family [Limimaricola pyoseonensis]